MGSLEGIMVSDEAGRNTFALKINYSYICILGGAEEFISVGNLVIY